VHTGRPSEHTHTLHFHSYLHCALSFSGAVYCYRSCLCVCVCVCMFATGGWAGGVRTLLQPARAQCLCLCEHFFHFSCAPGFAGCPVNSPSPFIPELCIFLGQAQTFHVILITIPPGLFRAASLSNSFNLPRRRTFDPVIISFSGQHVQTISTHSF